MYIFDGNSPGIYSTWGNLQVASVRRSRDHSLRTLAQVEGEFEHLDKVCKVSCSQLGAVPGGIPQLIPWARTGASRWWLLTNWSRNLQDTHGPSWTPPRIDGHTLWFAWVYLLWKPAQWSAVLEGMAFFAKAADELQSSSLTFLKLNHHIYIAFGFVCGCVCLKKPNHWCSTRQTFN